MWSREVIDAVVMRLEAGEIIRVADRAALGIAWMSIEQVLGAVVRLRSTLLHGTGEVIRSGTALRLSPGRERGGVRRDLEGFATDVAAIAMLKALFSNKGFNLKYPMVIEDNSPLRLTITGWRPEAERDRGYVHIIGPMNSFEREGETWQWVTYQPDVRFGGCVEVEKADFKYQVIRQSTAQLL
jgi:hypothetical protein